MSKQTPHVTTNLECPIHQDDRKVEFAVNVFRDADHHGLEVEACSQFQGKDGQVTCDQHCKHTVTAHHIHEEEAKRHREELATIGQNVIG